MSDTLFIRRDNGKPSQYIFTLRSNEDIADEHWDISEVNRILETAPLQHAHRLKEKAQKLLQDTRAGEAIQNGTLASSESIHSLVLEQEQYNRVSTQLHQVWRIISLISELQNGAAIGYRGDMEKYRFAETEFPQKYELLATGLSSAALATIKDERVKSLFTNQPENIPSLVYQQLIHDRERGSLLMMRNKQSKDASSTLHN